MPVEADAIEKLMGAFGKFQLRLFIFICIVKFSIAFNQLAIIFLAPKTTFKCDGVPNKCPCDNPVYDKGDFKKTIVTEFKLICERKFLVSFSQSGFQFGTLTGSIFYGMAADRFGRKIPILVAVVMQLAAGLGQAIAPEYWSFTFIRFVLGLAVGGTMVVTFVLMMEYTGKDHRELVASLYQMLFNVGSIIECGISYFVRDYDAFSLALTSGSVILLPYFCVITESPRWLLSAKRTDDAEKIITQVAKTNNLPTASIKSEIDSYQATLMQHHLKKATAADLFRTPKIRRNLICISSSWVTCGYCFYGMSQYVGHLSGNFYVNVTVSASFALLGNIIAIPLLKAFGRKTILMSLNVLTAVCLILVASTTHEYLSVFFAVIGVMATFAMFVVVFLYSGELFPTVVRNAAVGFCSMSARVGSIIAPFVVHSSDVHRTMPPLLFAIAPIVASILSIFLPETKGRELMNTLEEAENLK